MSDYTKAKVGYVYLLTNPSMTMIKIGMTSRDVSKRVSELNRQGSTALPTPWVVAFQIKTNDPYKLEQKTHKQFSRQRVDKSREYFSVDVGPVKSFLKKNVTKSAKAAVKRPINSIFTLFRMHACLTLLFGGIAFFLLNT